MTVTILENFTIIGSLEPIREIIELVS
jgi:hypothetical protein